jgi:DNA mismatch repair protein MutS2
VNADAATAERIGLTWLRAAVAPVGAFGRRVDERIALYAPGDRVRAEVEIGAVVALAAQLDRDGVTRLRAALRALPEPSAIVARLRVGELLSDADFHELLRFVGGLEELARGWDAAGGTAELRPRLLAALAEILAPGRESGGFYLADAFDPGLRDARAAFVVAQTEVDARREAIAAHVREAIGVDPVGEELVVLREVYDGELPAGVHVVRETATYRVLAIGVVSDARDGASARLGEVEERARVVLAERIAREAPAIIAATDALGALDRCLARVAFVQRWGGCEVRIGVERIAFEEATFAPLAEALAAHGLRYTPLSLDLRGAAVLTGPNMGGKSAALATAGFLCACVAMGVPPPARAAELPLLEAVVTIGGEGPVERARLLSSYAAEVVRARETLAHASPRALVLVDEFARTTGPREGRALLVALVEALRGRGAFALVATHFEGVAEAAGVPHLRIAGLHARTLASLDAADLAAALDAINAAMDYRIVPAHEAATESDALALAALLGLDADVVARARAIHAAPPPPLS